jgi:D-alanyl-D-alanine carboxypeptidase
MMVLVVMVPGESLRAAGTLTEPKNLGAHHAYAVMDANSGEVLLSDGLKDKIYPASTVKIMTAVVALERMDLNTEIKVKKKVVRNISSGAAKYGLRIGKKYTLKCLLHILLLVSGADAAQVIADAVGGSVDDFVDIMNAKAEALGMTGSHFDNPIGLDKGDGFKKTYATAYDYCLLTKYAMQNKKFCKIVGKAHYTVKRTDGTKERRLTSTNRFYTMVEYDKTLYQVIGTKTGTTNAAGHVFIATAVDSEGHEVICAYYSTVSSSQLFSDIRKLLNKVFKANKNGKIVLAK